MKQSDLISAMSADNLITELDAKATAAMWMVARLLLALKKRNLLNHEEIFELLNPESVIPAEPEKLGLPDADEPFLVLQKQYIQNLRDQVLR